MNSGPAVSTGCVLACAMGALSGCVIYPPCSHYKVEKEIRTPDLPAHMEWGEQTHYCVERRFKNHKKERKL